LPQKVSYRQESDSDDDHHDDIDSSSSSEDGKQDDSDASVDEEELEASDKSDGEEGNDETPASSSENSDNDREEDELQSAKSRYARRKASSDSPAAAKRTGGRAPVQLVGTLVRDSLQLVEQAVSELSFEEIKELAAKCDLKPGGSKSAVIQRILTCEDVTDCDVAYFLVNAFKAPQLDRMLHKWSVSTSVLTTKAQKAIAIWSCLQGGYINVAQQVTHVRQTTMSASLSLSSSSTITMSSFSSSSFSSASSSSLSMTSSTSDLQESQDIIPSLSASSFMDLNGASRRAVEQWLNPVLELNPEQDPEYRDDPSYRIVYPNGKTATTFHGGLVSARMHELDSLLFAYALYSFENQPAFRKGVLLRINDPPNDTTQIRRNLTGLFAEVLIRDFYKPFFLDPPKTSTFVSGEDDGGAGSYIDLLFTRSKVFMQSNAFRTTKAIRPGGTLAVEIKTGQLNYIRQQIDAGHVLRQAELHKSADISLVILSKDFKKTTAEDDFRAALKKANTEALALLPTKNILDELCINLVRYLRDHSELLQANLKASLGPNSPDLSTGEAPRRSSRRVAAKPPVSTPTDTRPTRATRSKRTAAVPTAEEVLLAQSVKAAALQVKATRKAPAARKSLSTTPPELPLSTSPSISSPSTASIAVNHPPAPQSQSEPEPFELSLNFQPWSQPQTAAELVAAIQSLSIRAEAAPTPKAIPHQGLAPSTSLTPTAPTMDPPINGSASSEPASVCSSAPASEQQPKPVAGPPVQLIKPRTTTPSPLSSAQHIYIDTEDLGEPIVMTDLNTVAPAPVVVQPTAVPATVSTVSTTTSTVVTTTS
jgi:hypothetical protein